MSIGLRKFRIRLLCVALSFHLGNAGASGGIFEPGMTFSMEVSEEEAVPDLTKFRPYTSDVSFTPDGTQAFGHFYYVDREDIDSRSNFRIWYKANFATGEAKAFRSNRGAELLSDGRLNFFHQPTPPDYYRSVTLIDPASQFDALASFEVRHNTYGMQLRSGETLLQKYTEDTAHFAFLSAEGELRKAFQIPGAMRIAYAHSPGDGTMLIHFNVDQSLGVIRFDADMEPMYQRRYSMKDGLGTQYLQALHVRNYRSSGESRKWLGYTPDFGHVTSIIDKDSGVVEFLAVQPYLTQVLTHGYYRAVEVGDGLVIVPDYPTRLLLVDTNEGVVKKALSIKLTGNLENELYVQFENSASRGPWHYFWIQTENTQRYLQIKGAFESIRLAEFDRPHRQLMVPDNPDVPISVSWFEENRHYLTTFHDDLTGGDTAEFHFTDSFEAEDIDPNLQILTDSIISESVDFGITETDEFQDVVVNHDLPVELSFEDVGLKFDYTNSPVSLTPPSLKIQHRAPDEYELSFETEFQGRYSIEYATESPAGPYQEIDSVCCQSPSVFRMDLDSEQETGYWRVRTAR